jgi:hypothetical protein
MLVKNSAFSLQIEKAPFFNATLKLFFATFFLLGLIQREAKRK